MNHCKVKDCDNPVKVKKHQLCHKHYERFRRYGDPTVNGHLIEGAKRRAKTQAVADLEEKQCKVCKKVKPLSEYYHNQNGWYYLHCKPCHADKMTANRLQKRLANPPKMGRPKVDHGSCAFDECTNKAVTRISGGPEGWYCTAHHGQWRRNQELQPLRELLKSNIDDKFRRCSGCMKVKTQEQFNLHTSGRYRQSQCKKCQYLVVRLNTLVRNDRHEDAAKILAKMPERLHEKYAVKVGFF